MNLLPNKQETPSVGAQGRSRTSQMTPSQLAAALGRLSKGKKKTLSKAEIARRTKQLAEARKRRWLK